MHHTSGRRVFHSIVAVTLILRAAVTRAQQSPNPGDPPRDSLPNAPQVFGSGTQKFRVVATKGLSRAFALAFLPNGDTLITERAGRLRLVRGGVLDPRPIAGIPEVLDVRLKGFQDVALHPRFAENPLVYFTYYKAKPGSQE